MLVTSSEAEDPNGEGAFGLVHIRLADDEVASALLSTRGMDADTIVAIDMPLGYAGQLGGKLLALATAKESDNA